MKRSRFFKSLQIKKKLSRKNRPVFCVRAEINLTVVVFVQRNFWHQTWLVIVICLWQVLIFCWLNTAYPSIYVLSCSLLSDLIWYASPEFHMLVTRIKLAVFFSPLLSFFFQGDLVRNVWECPLFLAEVVLWSQQLINNAFVVKSPDAVFQSQLIQKFQIQ